MTIQNKTLPSSISVKDYLQHIENKTQRDDAARLSEIMENETGVKPIMWGPSIVGYGKYHYKYDTGREGDTVAVGFSARKAALTIYGLFQFDGNKQNIELSPKLGTHTLGKGCVYIKSLDGVDLVVLKQMIKNAFSNRHNS